MITDPRFAPRRGDLPFLARRSRPKQASAPPVETSRPAAPAAKSAPSATSGSKIDYRRPDRERPSTPPAPPPSTPPAKSSPAPVQPAPAASANSLDLSAPSASGASDAPKIDFSRPGRAAAPPAPPAAASSSLDLSGPAPASSSGGIDYTRDSLDLSESSRPAASPAAAGSDSLDLADPPSTPAEPVSPPHRRPSQRVHRDVRVLGRSQHLLSVRDPTITLTRMQSGIGQLSVEAVCSPEVGDLRLGAVYQLRSGGSLTVQHADGHRYAPPKSRRPVIVATREEYERISLDLRQIRDIERIGIYAYSESRAELAWNGTLVLTTFGGARIELPLETLYRGRIAMLVSLYNLDGELVVRAELETIAGDVRDAARAYGYERITWRDERAPVD